MSFIYKKLFFVCFIFIVPFVFINSSDRTDALDLLTKCEQGSKQLEITVKNFGEKNDLDDFEKGIGLINLGRVKLAQTKYLDAKTNFQNYLNLEYNIYKSLAARYIKRVEQLFDETSNELAANISNEKVLKNFETANSYLENAKMQLTTKHYLEVVKISRLAKRSLLSNYEIAGKKIPDDYAKDFADNNNTIYTSPAK
ncbi:MAG: hypothetical protein JXB50_02035 [Spirochaetes bacterium]|nr:hypothetical protein [Spirochaetota bacterium]